MAPRRRKPASASPSTTEQNRQWVEHWRRVGPILEEIQIAEWKAMTDKERRRQIHSVMGLVRRNRPTRTTSGLVEFYRKLRKLL